MSSLILQPSGGDNGRFAHVGTRISGERTNRSEGRPPPPDGGAGAAGHRTNVGVGVLQERRRGGRGAVGFRGAEGFEVSGERDRETGGFDEWAVRRDRCGVGDLAGDREGGRQRRGIFGGASGTVAPGGPADGPLILPRSGGSISAARPRSRDKHRAQIGHDRGVPGGVARADGAWGSWACVARAVARASGAGDSEPANPMSAAN